MSCSYYSFRQGDYYCNKKRDYVNSDVYYKYCRNWDYGDCPIYKGDTSSSTCYLTSACVYAKGLADDCYELETLRKYRDTWLKSQTEGESLIKMYYEVAPKIVSVINDREDRKMIYEMIYDKMVKPCVNLIEQQKYMETLDLYREMTLKLSKEYC